MPSSDQQCVRSCLDGRPDAYRQLVERHQAALLRYLGATLHDADAAAEAAQEAFVRAYFTLPKLRKPEAFFSWLCGIADRVTKESRRAAKRCRTVDWQQAGSAEVIDPGHANLEGSVTEAAVSSVAEAVAKLPDLYREVILLRFYGNRSCLEISRDLEVPLGTVTKRLSRAYALLRQRLSNGGCGRQSEVPP